MRKALHPRVDINRFYLSKKEREEVSLALKIPQMHRFLDSNNTYKEQRKTNYSDQKQHRSTKQNNQEAKMERKTTVWTFQTTNQRNLPGENLDMTKKEKP